MALGIFEQLAWLTTTVKRLCCAVTANQAAIASLPIEEPYLELKWSDVNISPFANNNVTALNNRFQAANFTYILDIDQYTQRAYGGSNILMTLGYGFNSENELKAVNDPYGLITDVAWSEFNNCPKLEYVSLPKAQIIGGNTFISCPQLKYVNIPATTQIGDQCFNSCYALSVVNLNSCLTSNFGGVGAFTGITNTAMTITCQPALQNDPSFQALISQGVTVTYINV